MVRVRMLSVAAVGCALLASAAVARAQGEPPSPRTPPLPEEKPGEPFAFGDFTWLNGGSRQHKAVLDTPYFTPEFLVDVNYTASQNDPIDHTVVSSTALSRNNELTLPSLGFGGEWPMRPSRKLVVVTLAAMTEATNSAAQTPPLPAASAAAPAAPEGTPAAPAPTPIAPHRDAQPATPARWYDGFAADGFVDTYASYNFNTPRPQAPVSLYPTTATGATPASAGGAYSNPPGGNSYRAFDVAQGFALNWLGVNASYSAGSIGGTTSLRFGPGAIIYHAGSSDETAGLQFVKQAYATWKVAASLTMDFGKWDQPFGSEVADSQLNMNYTRSMVFWYMQPLWFSGLRVDYAAADSLDVKVFAANGWNNTLAIDRGKTVGAQVVITPIKEAVLYFGWVGGPQQQDFAYAPPPAAAGAPASASVPADVATASHWRNMFDLVADLNPASSVRLLFDADLRTESSLPDATGGGTHDATVYGGNLVLKLAFTDALFMALRGEYYHDEHGDTLGTGVTTDVEDGTVSFVYGIGGHLSLMLDGRYDHANIAMFQKNTTDSGQDQVTATLGVIASTK